MTRILTLLLIILANLSFCQSFHELWQQKDRGIGINLYQFDGFTVEDPFSSGGAPNYTDTVNLASSASYGVNIFNGWNFPIVAIGNDFSLGINPNIGLGVGLSGGLGLFLESPIYFTLKYGTDATWNKSNSFEKKMGLTAGVGIHAVAGYTAAPISTTGVGLAYIRPTFMAEFSFVQKQSKINKIRFHMNIGTSNMRDYSEPVGYPAMVSYTQFGIAYIRTIYG